MGIPSQPQPIILIGFMGTGKSTLGARLAALSGLAFADLDRHIEQAAGMSIPQLFATHGEAYFRDAESASMRQLLSPTHAPIVLATGGGVVLRADNRAWLKQHGFVVHTVAERDEIIRRLRNNRQSRPLLTGEIEERVDRLLHERARLYDFAHYAIRTDHYNVHDAAQKVLTAWREIS